MAGLTIGDRLGSYEILAALGEGGMGEVYRARDTRLKRDVAIKVLLPEVANDAERLARFQREAEVLAALNHPNIAHIYGLESREGPEGRDGLVGPFLVLELVEGPTLADRIAASNGRGLPLDEALPIAKQIAEALEAAHEQGIVHRDLKPANIKVKDDGTVKVLDFGLAKAMEKPGRPGEPGKPGGTGDRPGPPDLPGSPGLPAFTQSPTITSPALMTGVGVLLGTAAYMSPEQAKGRPVDRRADMWAFGCVLFEMLTGARAFPGDDVTDTIVSVLSKEPKWSSLPAQTPAPIRRLLRRCLERERNQRLGDAASARFDIQEASASSPDTDGKVTPPPQTSTLRVIPWALFGVATLGLVAVMLWAAQQRPMPVSPQVTRFEFPLPAGEAFAKGPGISPLAISADGTRFAYTMNGRLWVRDLGDFTARPVPGVDAALQAVEPVFAPDGKSLAFYAGADRTIRRVAVGGGAPVTLTASASPPYRMSWGATGILLSQGAGGVVRLSPQGGEPEKLVVVAPGEQASGARMLPGGTDVLFTLGNSAGLSGAAWDRATVVIQSLTTGKRTPIFTGGTDAAYVASGSAGYIVYAVGSVLFAVPFDLERLTVIGPAMPAIEGVVRDGSTAEFDVSATGTIVFVPGAVLGNRRDVALLDRQNRVQPLRLPPNSYNFPRISPDGRRLVVQTDDGKEAIVWTYDLSGTTPIKRLTFGGNNRYPIWTGDGTRIVFQSDREGDQGLYWQLADGSGVAERLTKADPGTAHVPDSSPTSGNRVSFSVAKDGKSTLWTLSLIDRKAEPFGEVQTTGLVNSSFSPDGRWLAYNSNSVAISSAIGSSVGLPGASAVFVEPFPRTGVRHQLTANGFNPFWSSNGRELVYSVGPSLPLQSVQIRIAGATFEAGAPIPIPKAGLGGPPDGVRNYDASPDGARIVGVAAAELLEGTLPAGQRVSVILNWLEELRAKAAVN